MCDIALVFSFVDFNVMNSYQCNLLDKLDSRSFEVDELKILDFKERYDKLTHRKKSPPAQVI